MRLLKKQISAKDGSGLVLIQPDTAEDLWHAYNLVRVGDLVRCTAIRKVVQESTTGSTSSSRKRFLMTLQVEKVDFDVQVLELRISGKVQSEHEQIRRGSHHTATVGLHQSFQIEKEVWDQIFLDRLYEAAHPERQAEIAAVVMQATGLAHVCLVTGALTITKAKIEVNIPKKRTGSSGQSKGTTRFYEAVYQAVLRHVDFSQVKVVLLGSPGFVKDDFFQYAMAQAVRRDDRAWIEHKSKFVLCHASSGHKHALEEVFGDPAIMSRMQDTKVAKEVKILHTFMRTMEKDPDRAYYGYRHVAMAQEQLAIDSLLVTDELFRSADLKERRQYVKLVEDVRAAGGQVYILSSMHVSGQQLQQVSGVAALLRFPMPDLEELEEEAARLQQQQEDGDVEEEDEEEVVRDPNQRLREDMADMGL